MDLVNKQVLHETFGKGKVNQCSDSYIRIDFPSGNKKFVFPDAFEKYLKLIDERAALFVDKLVQERIKERREEEQKLIELAYQQNIKRQYLQEGERASHRGRTPAIHPSSQSVFWIQPEEMEQVFTEWNIFTGEIKSGQKKGQPRRLARISQNSACLVTSRDAGSPEKSRLIVGAFLVDESFTPRRCVDGLIPAHAEHRLRLTEQEQEKMLFWNYYLNGNKSHRMTWNTGRHRYFENVWMAQILRDIVSLRENTEEQEPAQRFFERFCHLNRIDRDQLPEPAGALKQN